MNINYSEKYQKIFDIKKEDNIDHLSQFISFKILSEVENVCNKKNLKRKDLADLTQTSKSYITQLFQGSKNVNTQIMAKFEQALDATFEFKLVETGIGEINLNEINSGLHKLNKRTIPHGKYYMCSLNEETDNIINELKPENPERQVA